MKTKLILLLVIFSFLSRPDVQAAAGDENWDSRFGSPGIGGVWLPSVSVVVTNGNDIYVGGQFTDINGIHATNIAKWNGTAWSALGKGVGRSTDGVKAIAVIGSNIYVGGQFQTAGGIVASNIAKWNGSSWSGVGGGADYIVWSLAAKGTNLYVGGGFSHVGGMSVNSIARWNGSTWSRLDGPIGNGVDGNVFALAIAGDDVIAGGDFSSAGLTWGVNWGTQARRVARWNGTWSEVGGGVSGTVYVLKAYGNDLYVGGEISAVNGTPAAGIAKWNGSWNTYGAGISGNYKGVYSIAVNDKYVIAAGSFSSIAGVAANNIAKWNGSAWSALGSGVGGSIYYPSAVTLHGDNVYVGGNFSTAGGKSSICFARYALPDTTPPRLISGVLKEGLVTLTFNEPMKTNTWQLEVWRYTGGVPQAMAVSGYRWSTDKKTMYFNVAQPAGTRFFLGLNVPGMVDPPFRLTDFADNAVVSSSSYLTFDLISASLNPWSYALVNSTVICKVSAVDPSSLRYQWQRNGTNISGATQSSYRPAAAGSYRAIAKSIQMDPYYAYPYSVATSAPVTVVATSQTKPIYLHNTNGSVSIWYLYGTNFVGAAYVSRNIETGWQMAGQADFDGDAQTDFLWQKATNLMIWKMNGATFVRTNKVNYRPASGWQVASAKDLSGDGKSDFLAFNSLTRAAAVLRMSSGGTNYLGTTPLRTGLAGWKPVAVADFAGDVKDDIVWQNSTNRLASVWYGGTNFPSTQSLFGGAALPAGWNICGAADFTGDGQKDMILQSSVGQFAIRVMSRTNYTRTVLPRGSYILPAGWKIVGPK